MMKVPRGAEIMVAHSRLVGHSMMDHLLSSRAVMEHDSLEFSAASHTRSLHQHTALFMSS